LEAIKTFLAKYAAFIWAALKPLGSWGVFAIAAIDASFFGLPLDPVVAGYVYSNRPRAWLYVLMASAGSALGCIVLYIIGYKGGEVLIERRMSKEKFAKIRRSFDRHEFLALMLPAMMPPPFPFKLFVLSAAVFEMRFLHFLGAIFAGRVIRFSVLAILTVRFGPQIVNITSRMMKEHLPLLFGILAALVVILILLRLLRTRVKRGAISVAD
jgi:membrane protein YqaA with SNARE-associated domain